MKRGVISLSFILVSLSFLANEPFIIHGKIKKSSSRKVWIYNQDRTISDTVSLSFFGKFMYSNTVESEQLVYLMPLESERRIVVSIKPGSRVRIKTKMPQVLSNLKINGSNGSQEVSDFISKMSAIKSEIEKNEEKLYKDESADGQYYYDSIITELTFQSKATVNEFLQSNKKKSIVISALDYIDIEQDYEELVIIEQGIRKDYGDSPTYKKVKIAIYKYEMSQQKVTRIGQKAPILILPGINGEDVSMADLKGNYILIDFWASWCAPCRAEHPRLIRLYEKYHGKGFEIYSIALDKDRQKWINAIKKDKLTWDSHVSSLRMFDSPATKIYDVKSIPYNVLVDWEGNIMAFNLRGQKLEDKLDELFKDEE